MWKNLVLWMVLGAMLCSCSVQAAHHGPRRRMARPALAGIRVAVVPPVRVGVRVVRPVRPRPYRVWRSGVWVWGGEAW